VYCGDFFFVVDSFFILEKHTAPTVLLPQELAELLLLLCSDTGC
jgi:hypothetical protein